MVWSEKSKEKKKKKLRTPASYFRHRRNPFRCCRRLRCHDEEDEIIEVLSFVFWTFTLIPLYKYLSASGNFALYSLLSCHMKLGMLGHSSVPNDNSSVDNSESTPTENKASSILKDFFDKSATSWIVLLLITLLGTNMVVFDGVLTPSMSATFFCLTLCRRGKVEQGTEELLTWMLKLKDVVISTLICLKISILVYIKGSRKSYYPILGGFHRQGEAAKNLAAVNPERTIFNVKRFIGQKFEDKEVQRISATKYVGVITRLNVARIINEPNF
ncbi:hypothetical protein ACFE04_010695 [Oxalis oulophora]